MIRRQVCIIHGGDSFKSFVEFRDWLKNSTVEYDRLLYSPDWKSWLPTQLPEYDVLLPSMPNKQNAQYEDWSLYFSKIVPLLKPDAILIGHSLGGIFLAHYFSEHPPAEKFARIILVAAPHSDETTEGLGDFKLEDASGLSRASDDIHLFHSEDDPVVPVTEVYRYQSDLPGAKLHLFSGKLHFNDPTFPELVEIVTS